jgi:hypothetical protein
MEHTFRTNLLGWIHRSVYVTVAVGNSVCICIYSVPITVCISTDKERREINDQNRINSCIKGTKNRG